MKNKIFSLLLVILFVFGVSLLVKNQEGYLFVENRPKTQIKDIQFDSIHSDTNSVLGDQIYFRDNIMKLFLDVFERFSKGEKLICYDRSQIKINDFYLDNSYVQYDQSLLDTCANKAFNINEISNKYPEVKTYVYNPSRYLFNPILDSIWFPNSYEEFEYTFTYYLGDKVKYNKLSYQDDEIDKYFYKTDQHYNAYGADRTYKEIVEMINEDFNIGEPKELISLKEINKTYRGSYSDMCENDDDIFDVLCVGDYGINSSDYDYYINGEKSDINIERNNTLNDEIYSVTRTYDSFFNSNIGETIFDYHDETKPNILIITDSYIGPIKEVLSSHFNRSVIICGDQGVSNLSLDKTIKDNKIDIILVLWFQQNLYYNGYYFIPVN